MHSAFEEPLDRDSNAVLDLVKAGKLDEAEAAARALLVSFPEVPDGHDRLGMVYEGRGQKKEAADCYRKVIQFTQEHPGFDPGYTEALQKMVDELDPPA